MGSDPRQARVGAGRGVLTSDRSTIRRAALGVTCEIISDEAGTLHLVGRLLGAFPATDSPPDLRYRLWRDGSCAVIARDDVVQREDEEPAALLEWLVHDLNRNIIALSPFVAVHAGGVVDNGRAVILPGVMEAGKTTLTAGLVRAGCAYLSDEAVGFDSATGLALAYPKPLSIDVGAQALFPELAGVALSNPDRTSGQWQVPPTAIRGNVVGAPSPVAAIVFPSFEPGAPTQLEELGRAAALIELAKATFRFRDRARRSLEVLAPVVRGAVCYRLVTGDLEPAVTEVLGVVARDPHVVPGEPNG